MVLGVVKLYTYSVTVRREEMIKIGRGSSKVGVVAKIFARFARNYTYNPTILKTLDPPLYNSVQLWLSFCALLVSCQCSDSVNRQWLSSA